MELEAVGPVDEMRGDAGFSLSGRRALVTGSVRGLGLEMARGLANAGARVAINGRVPTVVAEVADRLRGEGLDVEAAPFDVTNLDAAGDAVAALGKLDILVNNVGPRDRRGVEEMAPTELARLLEAHLTSTYALCRTVAARMVRDRVPGRIINISSVMGRLGGRCDVAYATAKAGLDGLTRALAADLGPHGITVNSVAPGTFGTEVNAEFAKDPWWTQWMQNRTALGRWGQPAEIAGIVVFLAGDNASFITGQSIAVDGA